MSLVPIYDISLPDNSFTKILTFSCLHKESKQINDHMSEAFFSPTIAKELICASAACLTLA